MSVHRFRWRSWRRKTAWAALLLLVSAAAGAGQALRTSASLSVTATVVQSCTVEAVAGAGRQSESTEDGSGGVLSPTSSYRVRCGKRVVLHPAPPGAMPGSPTKMAPARVTLSADGLTLVVLF